VPQPPLGEVKSSELTKPFFGDFFKWVDQTIFWVFLQVSWPNLFLGISSSELTKPFLGISSSELTKPFLGISSSELTKPFLGISSSELTKPFFGYFFKWVDQTFFWGFFQVSWPNLFWGFSKSELTKSMELKQPNNVSHS